MNLMFTPGFLTMYTLLKTSFLVQLLLVLRSVSAARIPLEPIATAGLVDSLLSNLDQGLDLDLDLDLGNNDQARSSTRSQSRSTASQGHWQYNRTSTKTEGSTTTRDASNSTETLFTSARDPKCSKQSSSWDKEFLTDIMTEEPMTNPYLEDPFLAQHFPIRTEAITYKGNSMTANPNDCCGTCNIMWYNVTMHYWPEEDSTDSCLKDINPDGVGIGSNLGLFSYSDSRTGLDINNPTVHPGLPHATKRQVSHRPIVTPSPNAKRDGSNPSTVIYGTHTFVSPSIYLEIPRVSAEDDCGLVGTLYNDIMWSYSPPDISSVMPKDPTCWPALLGKDPKNLPNCEFTTAQFNFADLPCPPSSLRAAGGNEFIYHTAAQYEPMLMQPWRIHGLDPAWVSCSSNIGWDPYSALQQFDVLKKCKGPPAKCKKRRDLEQDPEDREVPLAALAETTASPVRETVAARIPAGVDWGYGEPTPVPVSLG